METKHWFPLRVKVIDFGKEGGICLSISQLVCSSVATETNCRGVKWKEGRSSKSEVALCARGQVRGWVCLVLGKANLSS